MADREQLLAQLQELKALRASLDAPVETAATPPQEGYEGFMAGLTNNGQGISLGDVGEGFKKIGGGLLDFAGKVGEVATTDPIASSMGMGGYPYAAIKTMYGGTVDPNSTLGTVGNVINRTGDIVSSAIPVIGNPGYHMIRDAVLGESKPAYEYGKEFRTGVVDLPAQLAMAAAPAAAKGAYQAGKGILQGGRDMIMGGPPEAVRNQFLAERPDAYARVLNSIDRTPKAQIAVDDAADLEHVFTRNNPVGDINPSLRPAEKVAAFKTKMDGIETNALAIREGMAGEGGLLNEAVRAEQAIAKQASSTGANYRAGISFDDIPKNKIDLDGSDFNLQKIAIAGGRDGAEGVSLAQNFVKEEFGMRNPKSAAMGYPDQPSRSLTLIEANNLRKKIQGEITAYGGYDDATLAALGTKPSIASPYVQSLRFYRSQLDNTIKNRMAELIGDDAAAKFHAAGEDYSMVQAYRPMIEKMSNEVGQAFGPGSVRQGEGSSFQNSTLAGKVANEVIPNRKAVAMEATAMSREADVISRLQQITKMKIDGPQTPLPRGLAQIMGSLPTKQTFTTLLENFGLITPGTDIGTIPMPVLEKMAGQVAGVAPRLFQPTPDNVNVINGKVQSQFDLDMLMEQAAEKPAAERAMEMPNLWKKKYVPQVLPSPMQTPTQPPMPDISNLNSLFDGPTPSMPSPTDAESMVSQLEKITAIHAQDNEGFMVQ